MTGPQTIQRAGDVLSKHPNTARKPNIQFSFGKSKKETREALVSGRKHNGMAIVTRKDRDNHDSPGPGKYDKITHSPRQIQLIQSMRTQHESMQSGLSRDRPSVMRITNVTSQNFLSDKMRTTTFGTSRRDLNMKLIKENHVVLEGQVIK